MKKVTYEDELGRKYLVKLADDVPDEDAHLGIPIGPPDIADTLELPEPFATRLHNILYERELWSIKEVTRQAGSLKGALQKALSFDIQTLHNAFVQASKEAD